MPAGFGPHGSVPALVAELADIGETVLLHHDGGEGRPVNNTCSRT
jgi:hypothetical protein